jgi:hypothetical protein
VETAASLHSYLRKHDLHSSDNVVFKDVYALQEFFKSGIGMPEVRFYDRNGYLMLYRDEKKCNGQNDSLISFLNPENVVKVDSSQNIKVYVSNLRQPDGQEIQSASLNGYDYYLLIYWAKYLGKVNSEKMQDWESALNSKSSALNIKAMKVATDYMDFWQFPEKDMHKIYSRKTKVDSH